MNEKKNSPAPSMTRNQATKLTRSVSLVPFASPRSIKLEDHIAIAIARATAKKARARARAKKASSAKRRGRHEGARDKSRCRRTWEVVNPETDNVDRYMVNLYVRGYILARMAAPSIGPWQRSKG